MQSKRQDCRNRASRKGGREPGLRAVGSLVPSRNRIETHINKQSESLWSGWEGRGCGRKAKREKGQCRETRSSRMAKAQMSLEGMAHPACDSWRSLGSPQRPALSCSGI